MPAPNDAAARGWYRYPAAGVEPAGSVGSCGAPDDGVGFMGSSTAAALLRSTASPAPEPTAPQAMASGVSLAPPGPPAIEPLWQVEKRVIEQALAQCDGNVTVAASYLGVSPSTVYRKIKQWGQPPVA